MLRKSWELGRKFFQIIFFSIFQCVLSMYWAVSMCASLILTLLNGIKWEILFVLHNTLKKLNSLIFITIHAKCIYNKHWHGRSNRVYHGNPLFTFTSKKVARVISLKNVLYFVYKSNTQLSWLVVTLCKWPIKCVRVGRSVCWESDMQDIFFHRSL